MNKPYVRHRWELTLALTLFFVLCYGTDYKIFFKFSLVNVILSSFKLNLSFMKGIN